MTRLAASSAAVTGDRSDLIETCSFYLSTALMAAAARTTRLVNLSIRAPPANNVCKLVHNMSSFPDPISSRATIARPTFMAFG